MTPDVPHAGPEEIAAAVDRLRRGGLVAFPTETVYGLGADALNPAAVARVFAAKGRPGTNPLIVHVTGEAMARGLASPWPPGASLLARRFWPGPLTIVVPGAAGIPDAVTAGGPTVALRSPAHHITLALLEAFGGPLVGPSANPSGRTSPTTADHVREAFTQEQVLVLDGGPCRGGIESTVVTLAETPARVLRPGLVSAEEIAAVLGAPVRGFTPGDHDEGAIPASPGRLAAHYAPRAPAVLVDTAELGRALSGPGDKVLLTHTGAAGPGVRTIAMPADAAGYASRLYAALREADLGDPTLIVIERPPATGPVWEAVADRLSRATRG